MQNKNLRKALAVSMAIAMTGGLLAAAVTAAPADLLTAEPQTAVLPHPQMENSIHLSL